MSFHNLYIGKRAPETVNALVEIPKGSHNKYEYDEDLAEIRLDRVLHSPVFYPTDYGFIPETRSDDGDHLDILVLISEPVFPGCIVEARPIGVLEMEDESGKDEKIIGVCEKDPRLRKIRSIQDVDDHTKDEIRHFFEVYKHLEKKRVTIKKWKDKEQAYKTIEKARKKYMREHWIS